MHYELNNSIWALSQTELETEPPKVKIQIQIMYIFSLSSFCQMSIQYFWTNLMRKGNIRKKAFCRWMFLNIKEV